MRDLVVTKLLVCGLALILGIAIYLMDARLDQLEAEAVRWPEAVELSTV